MSQQQWAPSRGGPCSNVARLGSSHAAPVFLHEAVVKASSGLQKETRFGDPSSGLPGVPGTAWHHQPRPSSSQTADLALALCDITGSHGEALTVSSPSSEPSCLCQMLPPRCHCSASPGFSLPGLQPCRGSLTNPLPPKDPSFSAK